MPDLQTLLNKFLADLYSGTIGSTSAITGIRNGDGTVGAPSYSFASQPTTGFFIPGSGEVRLGISGTLHYQFKATGLQISDAASSIQFGTNGDAIITREAAQIIAVKNGTNAQALRLYQTTTGPIHNTLFMAAPTISSGFGGSPSIVAGSTAFAFRVNVGSGGVATSGVIGMPTAVNGWQAIVQDMTNNVATRVTATTTNTITITAAAAWTANDILVVIAVAF